MNQTKRKQYALPQPARPENEHPFYQTWLEREGHLKRLVDDACVKIAELATENQALKDCSDFLPVGQRNTLRSLPR